MLSGVGGFVLGLIVLGLGLFIRHRSQKGKELWGNGETGCGWDRLQGALSLDELFPPDRERKETGLVVRRNKTI